ncbi:ribonuclease H-like superfamily protein [Striga asiatica]|uniref:Ribonuclease H-like superfamily protein n=1 Tax=Striga asiatica TaxID=4170 RepID=A0A5A7R1D3_STRAF|nr:ribonuclease H-like superfamily protein [Striga asiatica]
MEDAPSEFRSKSMTQGFQHVDIKDGASVKLNDYNWVPGIRGRRIKLKEGVDGENITVLTLIDSNSNRWNTQRVRDVIAQEDCDAILQIQGLDSMVKDKWRWELGVQGSVVVMASDIHYVSCQSIRPENDIQPDNGTPSESFQCAGRKKIEFFSWAAT